MPNQPNENDILDKCEKLRQKAAELHAQYAAMSPEERAEVDRLIGEDRAELEFLSEIIVKLLDGSLPEAEAERWLDETEREMDARQARRLRSKGE